MLLKFEVQNFRGFENWIKWDLSRPNRYDFNTHAVKNGVIKNGIIYGPNGSGKSNFSMAIFDLVNHLSQKVKKADYYNNFACITNILSPVNFRYTFLFDGREVEYSYTKSHEATLIQEELMLDGKRYLYRSSHELVSGEFTMAEQIKQEFMNSKTPVSLLSFLWSNYPMAENHVLLQLRFFVESMLWYQCLDRRDFIGLDNTPTNIEEYIIKNDLVNDFSGFLAEVSGQQFLLEASEKTTASDSKTLLFSYKGDNFKVSLPFLLVASTGTKALELLYFWKKRFENASFVFIDEFDAFYHFKLSFAVCQQLFHIDNCQIFLSSHNTYLMTNDLLRPDCNFVLSDGKIKPLIDCTEKELRFAHNIEKLYRGGTFSV